MAIWNIDLQAYVTAYIVADTAEEALAKLLAHFEGNGMLGLEVAEGLSGDFEISGARFDNSDFPEISLSPAMTVHAPSGEALPDFVDEGAGAGFGQRSPPAPRDRAGQTGDEMTLEELYRGLGSDAATDEVYGRRRAEKVAEIEDYISPRLRAEVDVQKMAESLMATAEEMGRIRGDQVSGEVAGYYMFDGNPLPFEV